MVILAIDTAWVGVIGTLGGAIVGGLIGGGITLRVERSRQEHERRQFWKRDQYEALAQAEEMLRSMQEQLPHPNPDKKQLDAISDMIGKLAVLLPGEVSEPFFLAAHAWNATYEGATTYDAAEAFYEEWSTFTKKYKRFLGLE